MPARRGTVDFRDYPTYYLRAYASGSTNLGVLSKDAGYRVGSVYEYIRDQAIGILKEQADHGSNKNNRDAILEAVQAELGETWADRLAANFKVEVFASAAERDRFEWWSPTFNKRRGPEGRVTAAVVLDFECPSNLFYEGNWIPEHLDDTPALAKAELTWDRSGNDGLVYQRLKDWDFLDRGFTEDSVYFDGLHVMDEIVAVMGERRLGSRKSKSLLG